MLRKQAFESPDSSAPPVKKRIIQKGASAGSFVIVSQQPTHSVYIFHLRESVIHSFKLEPGTCAAGRRAKGANSTVQRHLK